MRDIIFRGKSTAHNAWVCGSLIKYSDTFYDISSGYSEPIPVDPATIGQYTGINTPEEIKIFEGDRVKLHNGGPWLWHPNHPGIEGVVTFMECGFFVDDERTKRAVPLFQEVNWWEITGSIHNTDK